jgi:hypothetical protein
MPAKLVATLADSEAQGLLPENIEIPSLKEYLASAEKENTGTRLGTDSTRTVPACQLTKQQKEDCEKFRVCEPTLTTEQKLKLLTVLQDHEEVFAKTSIDIGTCNLGEHHIDTGDAKPIASRPHGVPPHLRSTLREELDDLLKHGSLRKPSHHGPHLACMFQKRMASGVFALTSVD